jgi:glycosyltransferase involved in cell wall biosynthesis
MFSGVVYLSRFNTVCGISTYTEQLAGAVRDVGIPVSAVTSDHTTRTADTRPRSQLSDIPCMVGWSEKDSVTDALRIILEKKPGIVHIQHEFGIFKSNEQLLDLCCAIRSKSPKTKLVITLHTVNKIATSRDSGFIRLLGAMDAIIVHSDLAKSAMGSYFGSGSFVVPFVVPHGMVKFSGRMSRKEAEESLGLNPEVKRFTLLSIGFMSMTKRHVPLLNLVPVIIRSLRGSTPGADGRREFNLVIAGADPTGRGESELCLTLKSLIDQMKLRKQIRLINEFIPFEKLPALYGAADACVHMCGSSQYSSSGSVRMDLSHGMPVFVQRAELTQDLPSDVVGFFDKDYDLVPLLKAAYQDRSILDRMSSGAVEMSRKNSWREVALMHLRVYSALADSEVGLVGSGSTKGELTMGSPKVAFVSRWGVQCGIATYTDQLANAMCQHGTGVVCVAEEVGGLKEIPATSSVEVKRCWRGKNMNIDEMYTHIKTCRADVVHFQHEFGIMNDMIKMMQLVDALRRGEVPIVFTCHTVMPRPNPETSWFFHDLISQIDAVVVHTKEAKDAVVAWGHDAGKVYVISHGTPEGCTVDERIKSREALYLPSRKDLIVAVSLGFITPGKMQKETIREVIWLVREGLLDPTKFLYIVAGEPGQNNPTNIMYCQEIHKLVDDNMAWNYIRIIPRFIPMDELPVWYGAADFAITASHQTYFSTSGRSHQEMAYGIPSISSNARLLSDLDETRSLKFNFDDDEAFQFRFHVLSMVRDPKLRAKLAKNCLKFANETSWTNISGQHLEMYKTLINRKGH